MMHLKFNKVPVMTLKNQTLMFQQLEVKAMNRKMKTFNVQAGWSFFPELIGKLVYKNK